jgi:hypothetical protein
LLQSGLVLLPRGPFNPRPCVPELIIKPAARPDNSDCRLPARAGFPLEDFGGLQDAFYFPQHLIITL